MRRVACRGNVGSCGDAGSVLTSLPQATLKYTHKSLFCVVFSKGVIGVFDTPLFAAEVQGKVNALRLKALAIK